MKKGLAAADKSLRNFFVIAFLIPIASTVLVTSIDGLQTGLVTTHISAWALVVIMSMVHAPTIAAVIVAYGDEGFDGIRGLFRQLKSWNFKARWYLRALLLFPLSILASLFLMSLYSQGFAPVFSLSILLPGTLFSTLWEEIGWTGYAMPRMLKRNGALKTALLLGVIHSFWHLAADYWGSGVFYGNLYMAHFLLWMAGLIVLRIIVLWIYVRTKSLVLGWLTHFSYTGGQTLFVSLSLSAVETVLWNSVFVLVLLSVVTFLAMGDRDFRGAWKKVDNEV